MKLLLFEFKKIFFSKRFLYIMLLLIIGIALLFARNVTFQSYIEKEEKEQIANQTKASQANSRVHRIALENSPEDEEQLKLQKMNSEIRDQLYELNGIASSDDWQRKLTLQNEIFANTLVYKNEGGDFPLSEKEIHTSTTLNEKLLKEGIAPEHDIYSVAMPNFMKQIVDLYIHFGAFVLLILVIGESMSGEYENHSINQLFTQPLKKTWIVTSKFWSSVLLYVIMTGTVLLSAGLIGLLFGEKGTFNYPMLIEKNNAIEFITISSYMTKGILLVSVAILMVITLYFLYSLLFKQTLATLAVVLLTLAGGYFLSNFVTWGPFSWFNPFANLLPGDMILQQNDQMWYQAIPITLATSIVLYILAAWKINTSKIV
ncbi:ABC transporter permease [Sporosarcina sp. Sa2YVA2]|uniref:ABC transporter permease n=1 Tax=Sporosarcina quadrami TaxID=2762234 RepID=A0ABR8UBJ5_9BACL|nr:ABC transporter permease subunit [Sporosarcina quadrami]MBD7985390.1 ABC transporter permease [Sporosarcina quadrami]